jgi:hypothetical protein
VLPEPRHDLVTELGTVPIGHLEAVDDESIVGAGLRRPNFDPSGRERRGHGVEHTGSVRHHHLADRVPRRRGAVEADLGIR